MTTAAAALSPRYGTLFPPTVIMAGDADEIVSYRQAQRLHGEVAGSHLDIWPGASHMIDHVDSGRFIRGIETAAEQANAGVAAEQI